MLSVKNKDKDDKKTINIIFLTGFLGSGKTTLLNHLLKNIKDTPVGIIVNEFGEINIDKEVIEYQDGMKVNEINGGSVFCSCLSGSFVKNILSYRNLPIEYLLVESTGLSRPGSARTILAQVNKKSNNTFQYHSMFCTVDASSYLTLIKSVNALKDQIEYSDLIIINKIDLVDKKTVKDVEAGVRKKNPDAEIIKTSFARVKKEILLKDYKNVKLKCNCSPDSCSSIESNETYLFEIKEKISEEDLLFFLEGIVKNTYRIKGFVLLNDRTVRLDCVGDKIDIKELKKEIDKSEIVIIAPDDIGIAKIIKNNWGKDLPSYKLN